MHAEIITIGDEILIGQVIDTNSAWIAQHLNTIGIHVKQISSVSDNKEHIINALNEAKSRADLILMTGGLGPTKDDITKLTLCEYFNTKLVFKENILEEVKQQFLSREISMPSINEGQAYVPDNCVTFKNRYGTAPGMWFETKEKKVFISMPGVPYEMKSMMEEEILPKLQKTFQTPEIIHRTILVQGISESALAELLSEWENSLPSFIKLAYLPSPKLIRLRLSTEGYDRVSFTENINIQIKKLEKIIPEYFCNDKEEKIEEFIGRVLNTKQKTLATAESCTGGYIAHLITSISGSSNYFKGAIIAYSNEIKENMLGVKKESLDQYGAVSKQVVEEMAKGVQQKFKTDYAIATSGIAGPTGGTKEKPVGTVWIALATPTNIYSKKYIFAGIRERNIRKAAISGLGMLREEITRVGKI